MKKLIALACISLAYSMQTVHPYTPDRAPIHTTPKTKKIECKQFVESKGYPYIKQRMAECLNAKEYEKAACLFNILYYYFDDELPKDTSTPLTPQQEQYVIHKGKNMLDFVCWSLEHPKIRECRLPTEKSALLRLRSFIQEL